MFSENLKGTVMALAILLPGTVATGSGVASQAGCTPQEARSAVKDALTVTQLACIVASQFTDDESVMKACEIEDKLRPIVSELMGQKRAAAKAAACAPDAGPEADAGKDAK